MNVYERMNHRAAFGNRGCIAYAWIGQSFEYCDRCGEPFWEHSHERRQAPGKSIGHERRVIITDALREAVRAKWEGYTERVKRNARVYW